MLLKMLKKPIKIYNTKIHWATIVLVAASFWFAFLHRLLVAYAITAIHELAHIIATRKLGIKIEGIEIMPFGITARLCDEGIKRPRDEIIIAAAGPLSNFVIAYIAYGMADGWWSDYIICTSLVIGYFNLLPALPLDGGRILRAILVRRRGCIYGHETSMKVTVVFGVVIVAFGAWALWVTKFNFSILIIGAFLIANVTEEIKSKNMVVMKDILYSRRKLDERGGEKGEVLVVRDYEIAANVLSRLTYDRYYLINIVDNGMKIAGTVTETTFVEALAVYGVDVSMRNFVRL